MKLSNFCGVLGRRLSGQLGSKARMNIWYNLVRSTMDKKVESILRYLSEEVFNGIQDKRGK